MTKSSPTTPDLGAQKAILRRRFAAGWECGSILASLDRAQDLYFDRVAQIQMPSWSCGRIALVGDAASCVSLMAGQGSALAMTAAYALAGELAKAGGRHDEAFSRYESLLRAFINSKQKGAERFSGAFAPRTRFGLFLRNQVIRACAIPGVAKLALSRDIADTLQLPDVFLASRGIDRRRWCLSSGIDQRSPSGRSGDILSRET